MAANVPLQDDTGQQILVALRDLTAAVNRLTQEIADAGNTLDAALADRQTLALCLQSGQPYTPNGYTGG